MALRIGEQRGFTLIELIITATVLAIIVVAVGGMLDSIGAINRSANQLTIATGIAQQQLERYRNIPYNDINVGTVDLSSALAPYPSLHSPRSATATVTQVDPNGLKEVEIDISYTGSGGTKNVQVATEISYKGINK